MQVYEYLRSRTLPEGIELCEGGLAGLDLLSLLQGADRIIFVDAVAGLTTSGHLIILQSDEIASLAGPNYDHAAGLPYLLRVLPNVLEGTLPQILLVGIEGVAVEPTVEAAAALAVRLALDGAVVQNENA